jgi:hypothetical protein
MSPGVDLIKLFSSKFAHFFKLDNFISNIYGIFMKRSSLLNRVSKFTPIKFYEIDPWVQISTEVRGLAMFNPSKANNSVPFLEQLF